jgi:hypothetical protein
VVLLGSLVATRRAGVERVAGAYAASAAKPACGELVSLRKKALFWYIGTSWIPAKLWCRPNVYLERLRLANRARGDRQQVDQPRRMCATRRPMRFGQLRRQLEGITQKMLTQTLRALEREGS